MSELHFTLAVAIGLALAMAPTLKAQEVREQDPAAHVARVFPTPFEHLVFHSQVLDADKNFTVLLPRSYAKTGSTVL